MDELYEKLSEYHTLDIYPMHMPGHKRNPDVMGGTKETGELTGLSAACLLDITEIEGFDNLGAPEDLLKESMERAARLYQADRTFFLVNGSTVGLLAGILGSTKKGDTILVDRNCHKAVYSAMYFNELRPVYLFPQRNDYLGFYEAMDSRSVWEQLEAHPETSLVVITSPTYEGVVSDIAEIAQIVHAHGAILLVDEAHGAHFGFHPYFPTSAITLGADVVIQSLHKTMPAFTQTALLHTKGSRAPVEKISQYLSMLQSTSPSYVLMAGMDHCIRLIEEKGLPLFDSYVDRLKELEKNLSKLKHLSIYKGPAQGRAIKDPSKIVIGTERTSITGKELSKRLLLQYKIQLEMTGKDYGIAMTSIGDTLEGFQRLSEALIEIDSSLTFKEKEYTDKTTCNEIRPQIHIPSIYEAKNSQMESIALLLAEGRISGNYIYKYPPGIPILAPGEVVTKEIIEVITLYSTMGYEMVGVKTHPQEGNTIEVIVH